MNFCKWIPKAENGTEIIFWFRYFKTTVTRRLTGSKQLELVQWRDWGVFSAEDEPGFVSHIRASSHEPGFRALPELLCKIFDDIFIWEGGLARFPRSGFFQPRSSVSGLEISPYEHFSPVTGIRQNESGINVAARMASSCIACCIFHIISIQL